MARGWESKSVESQIEAAESKAAAKERAALTTQQIEAEHEQERLQHSRVRLQTELAAARHPRHRAQIEAALTFLDGQLAALQALKAEPKT